MEHISNGFAGLEAHWAVIAPYMPNLDEIVILMISAISLWAIGVACSYAFVALITVIHGGREWVEKNYSKEDLERLRKWGL